MKKYKPTYCLSSVVLFIQTFIIIFSGSIPLCIILAKINEKSDVLTDIITFLITGLIVLLGLILISFIINSFMQNIAKEEVEMNDNYIEYDNRQIELKEIDKFSLFLGSMGEFNSRPASLKIMIKHKEHLIINKPSIQLLIRIKKQCKDKEFIIEGLKRKLILSPIIGFIVGLLFGLYLLTL